VERAVNDLEYLRRRVKVEAGAWKELLHPNIVLFEDCEESKNNLYFFLEYCPDG
jgi:serine/threonine protein kinase